MEASRNPWPRGAWHSAGMQVATAADAARLFRDAIAKGSGERLAVAYLDRERRLLNFEIEVGDDASAPLPIRAIAETALRLGASGLILAHNHPSGDPRPSDADLAATRRLSGAARALGLRLHDHLIFAGPHCHSMRAAGLL